MSPDPGRPFTVEPWHVREPKLDMAAIGQVESVFALSNGHIGLRGNLDEGEPHATPGTYLNSFYEKRPLPVRRGRVRLPGVRPDDHQRHQRQADPAARGGRAVRPALRRAAPPRAGARPAGGHADPRGRVGLARRARGARCAACAWCRSPSGRSPRSATRSRCSTGPRCWWCSPSWWPTSSCPPAPRPTPAWRRRSPTRCCPSSTARTTTARWLIHQTRQSGLRVAAAMDHEVERPREAQGHLRGHARTSAAPR